MTDHYTESLTQLDLVTSESPAAGWVTARDVMAQVHATLALAEHARISNLIALEEKTHYTECDACNTPYPYCDKNGHEGHIYVTQLRPEISRALRIETP